MSLKWPKVFLRHLIAFTLTIALLQALPAFAAENSFINSIQQRGYLKVGLPPYNTPPAYYIDEATEELKGYEDAKF